ncbi:MAG: PBSX family phage terminase large subunit [Burkholderiales bacterium]|nr:PBSX family phage terminase large subunit [Burkholderiales bacterium]
MKLRIETPAAFRPLLDPARYKGAYGGRGSGKSHFFAELLIEECLREPGTRAVCIREHLKDLKDSSKALIEDKIEHYGLGRYFRMLKSEIETPGGGLIIFRGMQDYSAESIKSLEGYRIAWIEEAQTLSERSLDLLRPTIRMEGSEIWACWNPTRKSDAIDKFLRGPNCPPNAIVVRVNWQDNPYFPEVLEAERQHDLKHYPERYGHKWEGEYARAFEGAYFAALLEQARQEGRIVERLPIDPIVPLRAYWDIGGAGAKADATAIWIVQFVAREIRVLDYIEGQGQVLAYYLDELRKRGYQRAICILPHDGIATNNVTGKRYRHHVADAGFAVEVIPNQGPGAAKMRIEAVRRVLPACVFDGPKTEAGRDALGYYHERIDEARGVGLGPEHDWSSHASDAFGLMAIRYEAPSAQIKRDEPVYRQPRGHEAWLA